jgi:hypothetical protein|tara:strand:+ start:1703 stop:2677 length:975 start_codon:yes stop_codon:yes gene_type:complete
VADTEFGSPAPEDVEASETTASIAAGIPLEDEDTDRMEAAYEATQREVEQDIHGDSEGFHASNEGEELLAGKYRTVKDLEKAYSNLEGKLGELGPRASESQELRERLERLEGQAQGTGKYEAPVPQYDPRVATRQAFANQRQAVYEEQGFGAEQARQIAFQEAASLGSFVDAEITSRTEKYETAIRAQENEERLQANAVDLRRETDPGGNSVRPYWDQVVATKEFEDEARKMGGQFHTRDGLELAYLRTLSSIDGELEENSSNAIGEARANTSAAKRRASVGPAATPASKTRSSKSSDDGEIEAIYETARAGNRSKNVFDGGAF